jgi:hypothetical protein
MQTLASQLSSGLHSILFARGFTWWPYETRRV